VPIQAADVCSSVGCCRVPHLTLSQKHGFRSHSVRARFNRQARGTLNGPHSLIARQTDFPQWKLGRGYDEARGPSAWCSVVVPRTPRRHEKSLTVGDAVPASDASWPICKLTGVQLPGVPFCKGDSISVDVLF
jgi:hypothetical protein